MQSGPLGEPPSMNSELTPRVSALEVGVRTLSNEIESVKTSVDRLSSNVVAGFAEIRRDAAASNKTNWGWVIAAIAVVVTIVGAAGTAWIRPLQAVDEAFQRSLTAMEKELSEMRDLAMRSDERLRVYREVGILPTVVAPKTN